MGEPPLDEKVREELRKTIDLAALEDLIVTSINQISNYLKQMPMKTTSMTDWTTLAMVNSNYINQDQIEFNCPNIFKPIFKKSAKFRENKSDSSYFNFTIRELYFLAKANNMDGKVEPYIIKTLTFLFPNSEQTYGVSSNKIIGLIRGIKD